MLEVTLTHSLAERNFGLSLGVFGECIGVTANRHPTHGLNTTGHGDVNDTRRDQRCSEACCLLA